MIQLQLWLLTLIQMQAEILNTMAVLIQLLFRKTLSISQRWK